MLDLQLDEFLTAQRNHLKTFDYKQHMARTVTTMKWGNVTKGTPMFWIFIFGLGEASCAYFVGQPQVQKIGWLMLILPWIQLVVSQIKMFISKEVVDADGAEEVEVKAGEGGKLIVSKNNDVIDN